MKNYIKTFGLIAVMLFALVTVVFSAVAVETSYQITDVEVDGLSVTSFEELLARGFTREQALFEAEANHIVVERGSSLAIEVFYEGSYWDANDRPVTGAREDTRIEVELDGYEYDVIDAHSEIFKLSPGQKGRKVLRLDIPSDIEVESSSDYYALKVRMSDDDDEITRTYYVRIEGPRHFVNVFDVILQPFQNVQAGTPLFVTVTLENLGDNVEDLVKVTASIPELGVQASDNVGELISKELENDRDFYFTQRDTINTRDLVLFVPESAQAKEYELVVRAEYNRGHTVTEKRMKVNVLSAQASVSEATVMVNVPETAKTVQANEVAVFKVNLANTGAQAATYKVVVEGLDGFATYTVNSETLTLQKDSAADVNLAVTGTQEGTRTFTVKIMQDNTVLATKSLSLTVAKEAKGYGMLKTVLAWIFVVLLAVLVILVIVLLVKRLSSDDEEGAEGKSFY